MSSTRPIVVYIAIPIKHCKDSYVIQSALEAEGMIVKNPCNLIEPGFPEGKISKFYADSCYEMIESADILVLYSDYYGRDCSAEVGYAIKSRKPVFPFSIARKESENISADFMIHAKVEPLSDSFEELIRRISSFFIKRDSKILENSAVHNLL